MFLTINARSHDAVFIYKISFTQIYLMTADIHGEVLSLRNYLARFWKRSVELWGFFN